MPLSHVSAPSAKRASRGYRRPGDSDDEGDTVGEPTSEDFLTAQDAIKLVRDPAAGTRASTEIEAAVWHRVSR